MGSRLAAELGTERDHNDIGHPFTGAKAIAPPPVTGIKPG